MEKREFNVSTLEEYIAAVKKIYESNINSACDAGKNKHLFFRGHSKQTYKLIPTVFRANNISEREVLLDFVHYGPQHNINYEFEKERIQILTDMQHNEIPTRLLDWSLAPLNSLFFAVENGICDTDAEVIVFNPWCYNQKIIDYGSHPRIHDIHIHARALLSTTDNFGYIKEYVNKEFRMEGFLSSYENFRKHNIEKPIAIVSNFSNNRILHQRGAFTIHGTDKDAIDKWSEFKDNAWRIIIDGCKKKEICSDLNKLYVNHYSVYPDFVGMKKQIEMRNGLFNVS